MTYMSEYVHSREAMKEMWG